MKMTQPESPYEAQLQEYMQQLRNHLVQGLVTGSPEVKAFAASQMALFFGHEPTTAKLLLNDRDEGVRVAAVQGLLRHQWQISDPSTISELESLGDEYKTPAFAKAVADAIVAKVWGTGETTELTEATEEQEENRRGLRKGLEMIFGKIKSLFQGIETNEINESNLVELASRPCQAIVPLENLYELAKVKEGEISPAVLAAAQEGLVRNVLALNPVLWYGKSQKMSFLEELITNPLGGEMGQQATLKALSSAYEAKQLRLSDLSETAKENLVALIPESEAKEGFFKALYQEKLIKNANEIYQDFMRASRYGPDESKVKTKEQLFDVLTHPKCPELVRNCVLALHLDAFSAEQRSEIIRCAQENPQATTTQSFLIARYMLSRTPVLTDEQIESYLQDKSVALSLAQQTHRQYPLSPKVIEHLANYPAAEVRLAVLQNKEHRQKLLSDESKLQKLAGDPMDQIREMVANLATSSEILRELATDHSSKVQLAVANNPHCDAQTVETLLRSNRREVIVATFKNHADLVPVPLLQRLLHGRYQKEVVHALRENRAFQKQNTSIQTSIQSRDVYR